MSVFEEFKTATKSGTASESGVCEKLKMSLTTAPAWKEIGGILASDVIATHVLHPESLSDTDVLNLAAAVSNCYFLLRSDIAHSKRAGDLVDWAVKTYKGTDDRGRVICRRIMFLCSSDQIPSVKVSVLAKGLQIGLQDLTSQTVQIQPLREILSGFVCLLTVYKADGEEERTVTKIMQDVIPIVMKLAVSHPDLLYPSMPIVSCRPDVAAKQDTMVPYLECLEAQLQLVLSQSSADIISLAQLLYGLSPLVPVAEDSARAILARIFLPSEDDRVQPIGKSSSLPSRLLKVTEEPQFRDCKFLVNEAQWALCGEDTDKFTEAIGFGYAAGYLNGSGFGSASVQSSQGQSSSDYHPITGQKKTPELQQLRELQDRISKMSEEEKGQEAEKLMHLFNRMKELGVVNFEHPMRTAQESGRFEELDD